MEGSGEDIQFVLPADSVVKTSNSERLYHAENREFPSFMPDTPVSDIEIPLVDGSTFMLTAEDAVWEDIRPQNTVKDKGDKNKADKAEDTEKTEEDTKAQDGNATQNTKKGGCGSSIAASSIVLCIAGLGVAAVSKKRD